MTYDRVADIDCRYCPDCGGEFRNHVDSCPDCQVRLTHSRPLDSEAVSPRPLAAGPVEVFATTEEGLVPLARAVLDEGGIEFHTVDRFAVQAVFGSVSRETGFLVSSVDEQPARRLLRELSEASDRR